MSEKLRTTYWIFMCAHCDYPIIADDLVVNDLGGTSCKNCGTEIIDVNYWNEEPDRHIQQSLCRFPDDQYIYTCCANCGNSPFDESDDVTVDNYGDYVCHCGGALELFEYETDINY